MHILIKCIHIENLSDAGSVNIGKSLNIMARIFEPGAEKKLDESTPSSENIQQPIAPEPIDPRVPPEPATPAVPPAVVR